MRTRLPVYWILSLKWILAFPIDQARISTQRNSCGLAPATFEFLGRPLLPFHIDANRDWWNNGRCSCGQKGNSGSLQERSVQERSVQERSVLTGTDGPIRVAPEIFGRAGLHTPLR
jgi:hypothetical protein